ncbi:uncharacterized protein LOC125746618 isoform X1 [Brienomyrus brachyistius]|uniref:uncharacterized protein LOC125746618 isoform X1 n=1 Tax=Brienomyrus brachyistius TaxID=42636 RepID=UPI0020B3D2B5|nr:uncharacterized protein LOC125746618 isoform X1 [Brienomyrus brachyistius]
MVSKEPSHLPTTNSSSSNNNLEKVVTVRSVLLNRDSPDIETRLKRRRNRTQQVRFKDLEDGGPECSGRCWSLAERGSPHPNRRCPVVVSLSPSKERCERDVRRELTANGGSVVGVVRGDMAKTIGAVAASLAKAPPHPLTPGPTRRVWAPSCPRSLTLPSSPRACMSTAIQTSPSLQKPLPFSVLQTRSHSLGDFVDGEVQEDWLGKKTLSQNHVLNSGAAQDDSFSYFPKHLEDDGLLAEAHGTCPLNSSPGQIVEWHSSCSPTSTMRASNGPDLLASSPLKSHALREPNKLQPTCTTAPEFGQSSALISETRKRSSDQSGPLDIAVPHAGVNGTSISTAISTTTYISETGLTSIPLPQSEPSSSSNAETPVSISSPCKTSQTCTSVHHTVPPNTLPSRISPLYLPTVPMAVPFSFPARPTFTTQDTGRGEEQERGKRRELPLPPPPPPPPPYTPRRDGHSPQGLNNRPTTTNCGSEHEKKPKAPAYFSEGAHMHPKEARYPLGQDPKASPAGPAQGTPYHRQPTFGDVCTSCAKTYVRSPSTTNDLRWQLMGQLAPSGPWMPTLNRISDTPLTPDQAETLKHVQELLGGLMSGACSKLQLSEAREKLLGPQGALHNVRGLQTQLQSLEGILEMSQNTIKVLLDVIQDLEKKEAERDGRHSYRTGQDIENCGTCRDCACIIYSVEHDFRLQEGQFTRAWRIMEPPTSSPTAPSLGSASHAEETSSFIQTPNATRPSHVAKKGRRRCFWFL